MKVAIADITLADDINIRSELRQEAVERYAEILDELPPIQIWKPNGKMLLVDGWHRIAAARRLGRTEIEAEVHEGDRTEAMVAAIVANTKHGVPLSTAERNIGISRLAEAGWKQNRIARELGLSTTRINAILQQLEIPVRGLAPGIRNEVIAAPREYRLPIAEAATASGWSQQETRQIAKQDDRSAAARFEDLLELRDRAHARGYDDLAEEYTERIVAEVCPDGPGPGHGRAA